MRSKSNFVFLVFCLSLLAGLLEVYNYFSNHFSDSQMLASETRILHDQIEQEKLKTAVVRNEMIDLRERVATALPTKNFDEKNIANYRLKELTQTLRTPASDKAVDAASVTVAEKMAVGRSEFKKGNYKEAARSFKDVVDHFSYAPEVIDAHFLLGESYYQDKNFDGCLDVVSEMVTQFPENEMTGYLMLRNAEILMSRHRNVEAAEIINVVRQKFSSPKLREQARTMASEP